MRPDRRGFVFFWSLSFAVFGIACEFGGFGCERLLHISLEAKQKPHVFFDSPDAINGALEGRFGLQGDWNAQNHFPNACELVEQVSGVVIPKIERFWCLREPGLALDFVRGEADFFPICLFFRRPEIGLFALSASFSH